MQPWQRTPPSQPRPGCTSSLDLSHCHLTLGGPKKAIGPNTRSPLPPPFAWRSAAPPATLSLYRDSVRWWRSWNPWWRRPGRSPPTRSSASTSSPSSLQPSTKPPRRPYSFGKGNVRMLSNPCSSLGLAALFDAWRHQQWCG